MIPALLGLGLLIVTWWTHRGPPDDPSASAPTLTHTIGPSDLPNIPQHLKGEILNG